MNVLVFFFIISIMGYYLLYTYCFKNLEGIFPLSFIAFSTVLLYLFGCIEMLTLGYLAVIMGGVLCLIIDIWLIIHKKHMISWSEIINPMMIFMFVGGIWCWVLSRGIKPSHFDDFSYWLRICKTMNSDLAFPCYPDCTFVSYVPGTATWIFLITRITGYSPENCYFAQMVLNLSCCCSMTMVLKSKFHYYKTAVIMILIGISSVFICDMDLTTYSLLVDGVLGLAASALLVYIVSVLPKLKTAKYWIPIFLVSGLISVIKASGIIFALFDLLAVYILKIVWKNEDERWGKQYLIPVAIIPVCYLLQRLYIFRGERVFGKAFFYQTQGTAGIYSKINEVCDSDRMAGIVKRFFFECFRIDKSCSQIKMLWIAILAIGIMFVIKKYKKKKDSFLSFLVIFCPVITIIYLLGVMVTYFAFNTSEANENYLACFYRYVGTITIMIVFIIVYYFLTMISAYEFDHAKDYGISFLTAVLFIIACIIVGFDPFYIFGFKYYQPVEEYTTDAWEYLEANYEERWEYNTDIYVIFVNLEKKSFDNYDKLSYVLNTYFRSLYCAVGDIKDDSSYIDELYQMQEESERNIYIINFY